MSQYVTEFTMLCYLTEGLIPMTRISTNSIIASLVLCFSVAVTSLPLYGTADVWGDYRINAGEEHQLAQISAISRGYVGLMSDGSVICRSHSMSYIYPPSPNGGFTSIAAGFDHCVGLRQNGSVLCWGADAKGDLTVPLPNQDFVAVNASMWFSMGLKNDGSVVCWGDNSHLQCSVPEPNTGYSAIAGGAWHSVGLKTDGSVVCWGNNDYGQCDVPEPNRDFVAVAAGYWHTVGLKADGSVVCWGENSFGQCTPTGVNDDFIAIAAGAGHSVGLKRSGSIVCWGDNEYGQCNVPNPNSGFISIDAFELTTVGLRQEYTITGQIESPGYAGKLSTLPLAANVIEHATPSLSCVTTPLVSDDGKYTLYSHLLPLYDIVFSSAHFLSLKAQAVDPAASLNLSLINGDADGDNQINLFDFVVLDTHFGSSDAMADLNGDGQVNLFDYMVIDMSFGAVGD